MQKFNRYFQLRHTDTSTSPALYGFPYTSSGKHECTWILMAAVHIYTSTGCFPTLLKPCITSNHQSSDNRQVLRNAAVIAKYTRPSTRDRF